MLDPAPPPLTSPLTPPAFTAKTDGLAGPPAEPSEEHNVEPLDLATLPQGWLQRVDHLLHHPDELREALRQDHELWALSRTLLVVATLMSAAYGAVMGASNWLQGSSFTFGWEFLMMAVTAVKVPILFLLTLLIVIFPIYVSSAFIGARARFSQVVAILLASLTVTTVVLASMASVAFFFELTTRSYAFIKLLHVAIFAYAGLMGLVCLLRWFNAVIGPTRQTGRRLVFVAWVVLYMFVGTQLAWVMRPFVGAHSMHFEIFRERSGNFYENVLYSIGDILQDKPAREANSRPRIQPRADETYRELSPTAAAIPRARPRT